MLINDIKPFVRYSRKLDYNDSLNFPKVFPVDARLFYILDGKCKIEIKDDVYEVEEGTVIYINAGTEYKLMSGNFSFYAINFDFTQNFSHLYSPIAPLKISVAKKLRYLEKIEFTDALYFNDFGIFKNFHSLKKLFSEIDNEYYQKLSFYRQRSSNLTEAILISIARKTENRPSKNTRFKIEEIIQFIQENFADEINNDTLSDIFHYHRNYISAEFKRVTGKSLHQYVLETRIMNAVKLIESGNRNISEIASLSGFNDSNYFTRYFKATIGITPGKYIKNFNENL